jgi:SAM-dependent methyltransferase
VSGERPALEVPDYDELWSEVYGDIQDVGPAHQHSKRILRRVLAPLEYETVLDVGCGFGHNLPLLTANRDLKEVAGVDISAKAVERAREHFAGDFHVMDVQREKMPRAYDLVFSGLVLEHLPEDDAALANMRAMTARHLVVVTIGGNFERYRPWEVAQGHVRNYQPGELEAKLGAAGFRLEETVYWGFPFYNPIVRTLQNRMKPASEFSPTTKLIARLTYLVYFLNSHRRGDVIIARASV